MPGGGTICAIGVVAGVRVMVVADDSGIDAGALQAQGLEKLLRAQQVALENKLPFVHLVESAGANLLKYRVEQFVHGGALFCNLARLSAAGLPVIAVVHGSSTAGGAYMTGLADHVIMVRGRARAFLAGPPLLKAATGEIATDEELGGADMHAGVSGLAEHVADDDASALATARELVGALGWQPRASWPDGPAPLHDARRAARPVRRRRQEAGRHARRRSRASSTTPSSSSSSPSTARRRSARRPRSPAFASASSPTTGRSMRPAATRPRTSSSGCASWATPIVYLQNTTGYMVGKESEHAGMIKHGSKMIQAVTNAERAADHHPVRRLVRRRQLRHVRARLRRRASFSAGRARRPR